MMLSPRWHKVIRDLWSNKTRTILVVLAIAVGVFAFGSVFITEDVLLAEMNSQYRAVKPSTITFFISSFDDNLVRWAHRQEEVADAQGRAVYLVQLVGAERNFNLNLYAYDDYEQTSMNLIEPETGTWPPDRREIVFERASIPLVGAQQGELLLVEMPDGRRRELDIVGTVHDINALPANLFPELTGYVSLNTLGWLGYPTSYNRLEILTHSQFDTLPELEEVADDLREQLRRAGVDVDGVWVREPDEHWGEETTESFTLILSFIGMFSLVLSGFLVVNTMSALLAEQRRQIGMMKAIGGTGRQIIGVYLVLVAGYGLLSLVVAVPIGMGLGFLFTRAVTQFLNVDILNFYLPARVLIVQVLAALFVPMVASAMPILGGVRITVREAISNYGIAARSGLGLIDRLVLKVRHLPRPVLLSIRNTFRRKRRLMLTLGTLTLAGALFITVVNVRDSLSVESDNILETLFNYEVQIALEELYPRLGVERRAESTSGVTQAVGRTGVQVQWIKPDGTEGTSFPIVGLPAGTDFVQPTLVSGRWLEAADRNVVLLSSNLIEDMPGVEAGDTITVQLDNKKYDWDVAGIVLIPFDRLGYANFDYVSSFKGEAGLASTLLVRTEQKDGQSQLDMASALERRLKDSGIEVSQSLTKDTLSSSWAGQFDFLVAFLMTMAAMTALIGGLGLAGMMSLNVLERTREIGVMRSIGASNAAVGGIVVTEGLIIGVISWALALPLSIPLSLIFNSMLGSMIFDTPLVFVFSLFGVISWLAVIVVVSVIASLLPAYRAIKMSIRETLAYE
jgi:putative ABC transport system permease protein